jgi:hypothetical protein
MALRVIGNMSGYYHAKVEENLICSTAGVTAGQAVYVASNVWTNSAAAGAIEGVVIKTAAASGTPIVEYVVPGAIIEVDLEGTLSTALVAGVKTAALVADGDNADATATTGGHLRVLKVDSANSKITIVPTKTFMYNTST